MEARGDDDEEEVVAVDQNVHTLTAGACLSESRESMEVDEDGLFKHSTTLTNKQRGNEVTVRPATLDCT